MHSLLTHNNKNDLQNGMQIEKFLKRRITIQLYEYWSEKSIQCLYATWCTKHLALLSVAYKQGCTLNSDV